MGCKHKLAKRRYDLPKKAGGPHKIPTGQNNAFTNISEDTNRSIAAEAYDFWRFKKADGFKENIGGLAGALNGDDAARSLPFPDGPINQKSPQRVKGRQFGKIKHQWSGS